MIKLINILFKLFVYILLGLPIAILLSIVSLLMWDDEYLIFIDTIWDRIKDK